MHENLTIAMYSEPTNECKPHRPQLARPLTREQLIRRLEQARDSNMLGILKRGKSDRELIEEQINIGLGKNNYDGNEYDNIDDAQSVASEIYPHMDPTKSMSKVLDKKGTLKDY